MIELYLSSDGKHTVHVSADTPETLAKLLPQAKTIYDAVVLKYGTRARMWQEVRNGKALNGAKTKPAPRAGQPVCPVHHRAMVYRQGRFGAFWSCSARSANGAWCMVTKDATKPSNGYAVPKY